MATRPTLYMFHFFRYYKNNVSFSFSLLVVTDHVSREGHAQSVPSVRLSVCPFVYTLCFEPTDL